jgi:hypothetical protein
MRCLRHWFDVFKKFLYGLPDWFWVSIERLTKVVFVVFIVSIPILMASLEETLGSSPAEPTGDCIRLMAVDDQSHWVGGFCFIKDAGAKWFDNLVEFPTAVSGQCEAMPDEQAKKECEERKRRRVDQAAKHAAAFMAGAFFAQQR